MTKDFGSSRAPRAASAIAGWLALALPFALALSGCRGGWAQQPAGGPAVPPGTHSPTGQASATLAAGASEHSIVAGGVNRTFRIYLPAGLRYPVPLVVMLHGGFGSGAQAERSYHWDQQADTARFAVAYPDGIGSAWNAGGGCCGIPGREGIDDTGFITQMVAAIGRMIPVDPARVYATGISNGGMLAYRLACDTRIFAAIGPDSATELGSCPSPAPISVIHIHGTADRNIPYDGSQGQGVAHIHGPAVPALNTRWRAIDHCAAPSVTTSASVTTSIAACPGGRTVELITIAGAGHQWPGAVPAAPLVRRLLGSDPPSQALDATAVIWRFFAAHPRHS